MIYIVLVLGIMFTLAAVVISLLFGIMFILAACAGGCSVAVLIKNKLVKKLLLVGFGVLFLIGLLCVIPFWMAGSSLPIMFFVTLSNLCYLCLAALAVLGIKFSRLISNKAGRVILIIVFAIVLISVISLAITAGLIRNLFLQG